MGMLDQRITAIGKLRRQLDRGIWQWCTSNRVLIGLLVLLACFLGLAYVLPQVPPHIRSDPVGYQEWLSEVQARFKSWTTFLETLGAFHIYETLWFRFLLAVLAFIILVSLGNGVMRLLRPLYAGQQDILSNAVQVTVLAVNAPVVQLVEGAWGAITLRFGRTVRRECDGGMCLYGAQNAWASVSVLVTYVGLLLLLAGLAINGRWGWQQSGIRLLPGEPIFVGREASYRVQLLSTQDGSQVILDVGEGQRIALKPGVRTAEDGFRYQLTDQGGPLVQVSAL